MLREFVISFGHGSLLSYIDGGSASLLIQGAIASVLTVLYMARTKFGQLRALLFNRNNKDSRR